MKSKKTVDIQTAFVEAMHKAGLKPVNVGPASMKEIDLHMIQLDIELELEKWLAWLKQGYGRQLSAKEIMAKLVNHAWPLVQKYHQRARRR